MDPFLITLVELCQDGIYHCYTEDGVINLPNKLQPSKAGGPDNIPSRFLRDYGPFLAPAITLIFQASLN